MRYGTQTHDSPGTVFEQARTFFGEGGEVGLPEIPAADNTITFATEIGGVSVSAVVEGDQTDVTILSREYDYWAEKFIRELH